MKTSALHKKTQRIEVSGVFCCENLSAAPSQAREDTSKYQKDIPEYQKTLGCSNNHPEINESQTQELCTENIVKQVQWVSMNVLWLKSGRDIRRRHRQTAHRHLYGGGCSWLDLAWLLLRRIYHWFMKKKQKKQKKNTCSSLGWAGGSDGSVTIVQPGPAGMLVFWGPLIFLGFVCIRSLCAPSQGLGLFRWPEPESSGREQLLRLTDEYDFSFPSLSVLLLATGRRGKDIFAPFSPRLRHI